MSNTIVARLAGDWVFVQNNGGPKLNLKIAENGVISLTMGGQSLPSFQGAAYLGKKNSGGDYPVIMSIFDTSPSSVSNPMGFSITNYTGLLIPSEVSGGDTLVGTATGVQENSSVETFGWNASHLYV